MIDEKKNYEQLVVNEDNTMIDEQTNEEKIIYNTKSAAKKARDAILGGAVVLLVLILIDYGIYIKYYKFILGKLFFYVILIFTIIIILVIISSWLDLQEAKKIDKIQQDAFREEKEYAKIDPDNRAFKAEKMFKLNQNDLMRYYDMNLAQTKFLSKLGILMIFIGVLIVVATIVLYVTIKTDKVLLIIGNVNGIVVDFVGAVFIKMYTQNIEAAIKFHATLAESNNLLLSNYIANMIEDTGNREKTLSDISKKIIDNSKKGNDN